MFTKSNRRPAYVQLGEPWLRAQKARILQRHLQYGGRIRLDIDSLLSRAALLTRFEVQLRVSREDFMRRATVEAVEHCLRHEAVMSTAVLEPDPT